MTFLSPLYFLIGYIFKKFFARKKFILLLFLFCLPSLIYVLIFFAGMSAILGPPSITLDSLMPLLLMLLGMFVADFFNKRST